jgi:hypothetical protein
MNQVQGNCYLYTKQLKPEIPKHAGLTDKYGKNQFGLEKHWFPPD